MMETERPFLAQPVPKSLKTSFEKLDAALWIAVSACRLSLLCYIIFAASHGRACRTPLNAAGELLDAKAWEDNQTKAL